MRAFKKTLSLILAVAIVLSMVPAVFAASTPEIAVGNGTADISGGATTVQVPVTIENNPGFAGMDLNFSIPDGWSIKGIAVRTKTEYSVFYALNEFEEMDLFAPPQTNNNKNGAGSIVVAYGQANITTNGGICWVTYSVPAGIINGDYEINVTANKINTVDATGVDISDGFTFTAGTITVTGGIDVSDFVPEITNVTGGGEYVYDPAVSTATLSVETQVTADSAVLSYKWFKEGSEEVIGTSETFKPALPAVGSSASYYCVVTEETYGKFDTSDVVTVSHVKDAQDDLTISSSDAVVYGDTLTLSVNGGSGTGDVSYAVVEGGTGAATISGNVLTPTKVGTVFVKATKAADGNYNAATSAQKTITITKADLTLIGADSYDVSIYTTLNPVTVTLPTVTAKGSDVVNKAWSQNAKVTIAENAGAYTFAATNAAAAGDEFDIALTYSADNHNDKTVTYHVTVVDKVLTGLTITNQPTDKTYVHGDIFTAGDMVVKASYDDGSHDDNFTGYTVKYANGACLKKGDTKVTLEAGGESVDVTGLTVGTKELTISGLTAADRSYNGSANVVISGGTLNGVLAGETVTVIMPTSGTVASANVGNGKVVSVVKPTLAGADAGNYTLADISGVSVNITKAPLTVTAKDHSITYGEAPASNGVTYNGFVNGETDAVLDGALDYDYSYTQYSDVGTYDITPKGLDSDNYAISFVKGSLTVGQKEVYLTWNDVTDRVYGDGKSVSADVNGFVNNDNVTATVSNGAQTDAGTYTATASLTGTKAGNYKLAAAAATMEYTIERKVISVPSANTGLTYTGAEQTGVNAAADGSYTIITGNTGINQGGYTAVVTPAANYKWADGTDAKNVAWSIGKAAAQNKIDNKSLRFSDESEQSYTVEQIKTLLGDTNAGTEITITGVSTGTNTVLATDAAKANDGSKITYKLKSGLTADDKNRTAVITINYSSNNYENGTVTLTVSVMDKNKVDDKINFDLSNIDLTYNGQNQIDAVKTATMKDSALTGTITYSISEAVNAGSYTVTATYDDADNFGTATQTFTIKQKGITISGGTVVAQEYDGDVTVDSLTNAVVTGAVNGETLAVGTDYEITDIKFANANAGTGKAVTYAVLLKDTAKANNYKLNVATGATTGTITAKAITVTLGDIAAVTYTGLAQTPAVEVTAANLIDGDSLTAADYLVTYSNNVNAGTATAKVTAKAGSNYTFEAATQTFTIQKADLTIAAENLTVEYTGVELEDSAIKGTAKLGNKTVAGTWSWVGSISTNAGEYTAKVKFTPAEDENFNIPAEQDIQVTITKADISDDVQVDPDADYKDMTLAELLEDLFSDVFGDLYEELFDGDAITIADKDGYLTVDELNETKVEANKEYTWVVDTSVLKADLRAKIQNNYKTEDGKITGKVTPYTSGYDSIVIFEAKVGPTKNGTVSLNVDCAVKGTVITVVTKADEGYQLNDFTVVGRNGNKVAVTDLGDGRFFFVMPNTNVSVGATFETISSDEERNYFVDITEDDWFYDGVYYAYDMGLINGIGNQKFGPDVMMTRGMLMTLLARLDGVDTTGGAVWYTKGVEWAVTNGISDGTRPEDNISREQMVAMLYNYAQYKGIDVSVGEDTNILSYGDASKISEWAIPAMQWAVGEGLVNGDGTGLNPAGTANRAQVATLFMRYVENVIE